MPMMMILVVVMMIVPAATVFLRGSSRVIGHDDLLCCTDVGLPATGRSSSQKRHPVDQQRLGSPFVHPGDGHWSAVTPKQSHRILQLAQHREVGNSRVDTANFKQSIPRFHTGPIRGTPAPDRAYHKPVTLQL